MQPIPLARYSRPMILLALLAALLLLGSGQRAWATPSQRLGGQSVPTATPGGPAQPPVATPAAPAAPGEVRQPVVPGVAANVASADGAVAVELPANAVSAPGTVTVRSMPAGDVPGAGAGFKLLGQASEVSFYDQDGNPVEHPSFANPVQICFAYSAAELAGAANGAADLVVQYYDSATAAWVVLPTTADGARACGSTSHFTLFGLSLRLQAAGAAPAAATGGLPVSGAPATASVPQLLWPAIGLALLAGVALLVRARRARRSA